MLLFVQYPKCTTCRKAESWLKEKKVSYESRNIKEQNPTEEELTRWIAESGLSARKFFNTSGLVYKELQLKDKLGSMTEQEMTALLATDGMLVKRPLLISDGGVCVGFKEAEWEKILE